MIGFFSRTIRKTVLLAIASDSTGNSVLSEADLMVSPSVLSRGFAWQQDGGVCYLGRETSYSYSHLGYLQNVRDVQAFTVWMY